MAFHRWNKQRRAAARRRRLAFESLESRVVLHGESSTGESSALDSPFLPPQYRLQQPGELLSGPSDADPLEIASAYLAAHATELGLTLDDLANYVVSSQYSDEPSGTTHIYLRQTHDGLEVVNADLGIHVTASGEVILVTSSFLRDPQVMGGATPEIAVEAPQALAQLSSDLGLEWNEMPQIIRLDTSSPERATWLSASGALEDVPAKLVYVPTAAGLQLAWRLNVQTTDHEHWFDAFVDADSGQSLYADDWYGHMSYRVFDSPLVSPNEGGRTLVVNPADATASPYGWHDSDGLVGAEFLDTRGNNALVQEDADHNDTGGTRPSGGAGLDFDFALDTSQNPVGYQSAAATNMFYWINRLHDIHYQYGFTEAAGNFQTNNYGRGGVAGDPVQGDIQDGDGGGPAFGTPPDGQSPRMQMYLNTTVSPARDSALDNTVLIHEYGHGVSERLTGGPANTSALNALQSTGLSEGWSDWWALMLTQDVGDAKLGSYPVGNWYWGQSLTGPGARRYPYSFDKAIDPLTWSDFNNASTRSSRHKMGEIWCAALWDMNWLLIDKYGFSPDLYHGNGGNNLALQLVMDGLKLQGTNPSYLDARDAILAADVVLTGGQNHAEIWTAFARRGMGVSASDGGGSNATTVTEAFDVPGTISGTVFRDDDADGVRDAGEPGLPGWTVFRDLNNNGVADVATVTTLNSTDTPKVTASPFMTSSLVVSGLSGVVGDLNLRVNITHASAGELVLNLIAPNSAVPPITLAQYLGGTNANYTNTVFDDEAAIPITSASAPFTGTFRSFSSLAQADGISPNGTWRLRIDDLSGGFSGTLVSWSLEISAGNPDPTAITDADGNYTFFHVPNGTHHVREMVAAGFTWTVPVSGVRDVSISNSLPVGHQDFGNRAAAIVPNGATLEDTLSSAIVVTPPAGFGATHFKISGISGGTLFQSNGTTPIQNGDFITVAQGLAGVRFLPSPNSTSAGSFLVEISKNGTSVAADASSTACTVTITPVGDTPQVANVTTLEDTLSAAIVLSRHASDGSEVTHFRVSNITGGTLFKNDGTTPIASGDFLSYAEGQAGVKFLPAANSNVAGHFDVESSQNGTTVAAQSGRCDEQTIAATSARLGSRQSATRRKWQNARTLLDDAGRHMSAAILLSRHASDGGEVTHFRVSKSRRDAVQERWTTRSPVATFTYAEAGGVLPAAKATWPAI
ncbi:MAG: M36 family metallopeptidase [Pirellulales bacterium]